MWRLHGSSRLRRAEDATQTPRSALCYTCATAITAASARYPSRSRGNPQTYECQYPKSAVWGKRTADCHAALQAMWAQYDHVVPFTLAGDTRIDNLIVTCAPCNFSRMEHSVEPVGLIDPRTCEPVRSSWDGLERFRRAKGV
jgi:hypothetical protein